MKQSWAFELLTKNTLYSRKELSEQQANAVFKETGLDKSGTRTEHYDEVTKQQDASNLKKNNNIKKKEEETQQLTDKKP